MKKYIKNSCFVPMTFMNSIYKYATSHFFFQICQLLFTFLTKIEKLLFYNVQVIFVVVAIMWNFTKKKESLVMYLESF
jgi:hypothetical protein